MREVAKIMKEYFEGLEDPPRRDPDVQLFSRGLLTEQHLPVVPAKVKWEVVDGPERFVRRFEFADRRRLIDFVNDVLIFEDELKHHGELKVGAEAVDISVYTHTVEAITELDQEYVRAVDEIYRDVSDYNYGPPR